MCLLLKAQTEGELASGLSSKEGSWPSRDICNFTACFMNPKVSFTNDLRFERQENMNKNKQQHSLFQEPPLGACEKTGKNEDHPWSVSQVMKNRWVCAWTWILKPLQKVNTSGVAWCFGTTDHTIDTGCCSVLVDDWSEIVDCSTTTVELDDGKPLQISNQICWCMGWSW